MNHSQVKQFLDFCKKYNLNPEDDAHYNLFSNNHNGTDNTQFPEYTGPTTPGPATVVKTVAPTKKPVKAKQHLPEEEHDVYAHRTERNNGTFNFGIEILKNGKWLKYSPNDLQSKALAQDIKKMYEANSWTGIRSPHIVAKVKVRFGSNGAISSTGDYTILSVSSTPAAKPIKNALVHLPKPNAVLNTKSITIKKSDVRFTTDTLLHKIYDPKASIKSASQEIRGRVAEIGFGVAYPEWVWNNTTSNNSAKYDFVEPHSQTTLDVKSIIEVEHNLLIEQSKVDNANMANVFALCLIVEKDDCFHFLFIGFITEALILKYTNENPFSLMGDIRKYKIPKSFLLPTYTV